MDTTNSASDHAELFIPYEDEETTPEEAQANAVLTTLPPLLDPAPTYTWVTKKLAVGGVMYWPDEIADCEQGWFSHVLDVRGGVSVGQQEEIRRFWMGLGAEYVNLGFDDDGRPKTHHHLYGPITTAADWLLEPNTRVLIHCAAGYNRAPSVAYGALRLIGYGQLEAELVITTKRECAMAYRTDVERVIRRAVRKELRRGRA